MKPAQQLVLVAAGTCLLAGALRTAHAATRVANIDQGTNIALTLSPDEHTLVISLLGGLWRLPASGGAARELTPTGQGADNPRFGPRGHELVYQRDDDGQCDLWLLDLPSGKQHRLTDTPYDERQPDFTPDGRSVVFTSNETGHYQLWSLDLASGRKRRLTNDDGDDLYPTLSAHGDIAFVRRTANAWSLQLQKPSGSSMELYESSQVLSAPSWRPGGDVLVFHERDGLDSSRLELLLMSAKPVIKQLTEHEDVFAKPVAWGSPAYFLYAADGRLWRRGLGAHERTSVPFFAGVGINVLPAPTVSGKLDVPGPQPVTGIGGWTVAPGGKRYAFTALGDLWLLDGNKLRRLTNDTYVERDPDFFPDGRRIAFATDRGGRMDLWSIDAFSNAAVQLTHTDDKAFLPAVDPTGRRIAFLETAGFGPWAESSLMLLDLERGGPARTVARGLIDARSPRWIDTGGSDRIAVQTRATPAAARRWVAFDLQGRPRDASGGRPTLPTAPAPLPQALRHLSLQWRASTSADDYVVQVGRLFDGVHTHYLHDVDIHVRGERIVAVVPRGTRPLPAKVFDARDATIIPGLIDVHAHQSSLAGRNLGTAWLAYGVTTVRELAADFSKAVERGEVWASGRRLGPRLVVSPTQGAREAPGGPPPAPGVLVLRTRQLLDGFAHRIPQYAEAIGTAEAPLPDAIRDLGTAHAPDLLRLSPLEHSYDDTLDALLASGAVVASTLGAAGGPGPALVPQAGSAAGATLRQLFSAAELQRWSQPPGDVPEPTIRPLQQFLLQLVRRGGHVAIGSDAPAVPYGYGVLEEMQLLAGAGIPNDQVLRIASAEGAIALGLGRQLGTVQAGKLADFVVLDGDPLTDISDTQRIVAVVKGGIWLSRKQLLGSP